MESEKEVFVTDEGVEVTIDEKYFENEENQEIPENVSDVENTTEISPCICQDPDALPTEGIEVICDLCGGVYYVSDKS